MKVVVLTPFRSRDNFNYEFEEGKEYELEVERALDLIARGLVSFVSANEADYKSERGAAFLEKELAENANPSTPKAEPQSNEESEETQSNEESEETPNLFTQPKKTKKK